MTTEKPGLDDNLESYLQISRINMGETIKKIREKKGYNQEQLAVIMKVSRSTISKIEGGKFNCSMDYLSKFSYHLNFTINLIERE